MFTSKMILSLRHHASTLKWPYSGILERKLVSPAKWVLPQKTNKQAKSCVCIPAALSSMKVESWFFTFSSLPSILHLMFPPSPSALWPYHQYFQSSQYLLTHSSPCPRIQSPSMTKLCINVHHLGSWQV